MIETENRSNEAPTTARQQAAEPEGALRAELTARLSAAQAELERQVDEISRAAGAASGAGEARAQLSKLTALQRSVSTASSAALIALQASVQMQVAVAQAMSGSMRASGPTQDAARAAEFAAINAETRQTAQSLSSDLYERRIFDPYLSFNSAADETEYRKREAESQRYVAEQLAKQTPEGNLNATGALAGQMLDAHAHGAGDSPDFAPRWERVTSAIESQRQIVQMQGHSTEEFDRNLAASVHRYLKSKGLSDDEIAARLALDADPLAAVKPYLQSEEDAKALDAALRGNAQETPAPASVTATPKETIVAMAAVEIDNVVATLRGSGATAAINAAADGHGLSVDISQQAGVNQMPRI